MLSFSNERDGPEVSVQAVVTPAEWLILQCPQGDRYLMGILSNDAVRSTSAIASALRDPSAVVTSSGRMYHLMQAPAKDPEVRLKLLGNAMRIGLCDFSDVSEQLWSELINPPVDSGSDASCESK